MSRPKEDFAIDAAHHHSDLNIFGAIVALLEGGTLYSQSGHDAAHRVIRICKEECGKQLRLYDTALRRVGVK